MKRVLILDANQRSALSVTRSLGQHNVPVLTADSARTALAGCSRYSLEYFQYPEPAIFPEQFINSLSKIIAEHNIQVVFPITELTTTLLLENQNKLHNIVLPFPALDTITAISNKSELMRTAESLKVPIPPTWHETSTKNMHNSLSDMPYPLVLKPGMSWLKQNGKWLHTLVQFADNPKIARRILTEDPAFSTHPFMLQKCVQGHGQGIFALYNKGEAVAFFSHRRIREKPYWGGVSVLSESTEINPALLAYSRTLLDAASWHGIAMVEFKVNKDGTAYLMEINTRFWGSLQLAIDAGVDFPWLLYQIALQHSVDPVTNYKIGVRLRWLLGDLDGLYICLKDRKLTVGQKTKAILQFLMPKPLRTKHEVNRWHDMAPFWHELKQYIKDLAK